MRMNRVMGISSNSREIVGNEQWSRLAVKLTVAQSVKLAVIVTVIGGEWDRKNGGMIFRGTAGILSIDITDIRRVSR